MSCPDATADLALPGLDSLGFGDRAAWRSRLRTLAPPLALAAVVVGVAFAAGGPLQAFADALARAVSADLRWVLAGVAFEILSFGGYVALLTYVAAGRAPRLRLRESYQVTLAGAAITRLLPTAGAGGVALTLWSFRRAGLHARAGVRMLLTFLVLLYGVFLAAIAVAGGLIALGVVPADGPLALAAVPAVLAAAGIAAGLALGLRTAVRPAPGADAGRRERLTHGASVLGEAVRDALGLVRGADPRLLGAFAWWAFDVAVLWAVFNAFGAPPALAVLALGYFVGQVGNTLPIPGAVSGGMVGVLLAFGVEADLALASVLAYRAIALWLPAPAGLHAIVSLRRTARRWSQEDAQTTAGVVAFPARPRPVELAA